MQQNVRLFLAPLLAHPTPANSTNDTATPCKSGSTQFSWLYNYEQQKNPNQ